MDPVVDNKEFEELHAKMYAEIHDLPKSEQINRVLAEAEKTKKNKLDFSDPLFSDLVIDVNEPLPPPKPFLVQHTNGKEVSLGTLGNFSVITGKAKSRKTFSVVQQLSNSPLKLHFLHIPSELQLLATGIPAC